ncbi:MAG: hypothetical protein Q9227_004435 [Pyrenula ochraceoflavens]
MGDLSEDVQISDQTFDMPDKIGSNSRTQLNGRHIHPSTYWGSPQKTGTAFDFRSEIVTTPSTGMLEAIINTTLNDDVYREDFTTSHFEQEMAALCGHEAGAFVLTGTMANQLSLMTLLAQPPHAVLANENAHILNFEAGGASHLTGAMLQAVRPTNGKYLTLGDIRRHAVATDDIQKCPTKVISLEQTTSGGNIIPLDELRSIYDWARHNNILVHLDGSRLWEAVATGAGSIRDFAQCSDIVTLEFGKNLGAPMGAMVLGLAQRIQRLRRLRKSIGGGMRQAGVLTAPARQAVLENFGNDVWDSKGILLACQERAKQIGEAWVGMGGGLLREVQTNMVWVDLAAVGLSAAQWNEIGRRHGVRLDGERIVIHHQIFDGAIERLKSVFEEVLRPRVTTEL